MTVCVPSELLWWRQLCFCRLMDGEWPREVPVVERIRLRETYATCQN